MADNWHSAFTQPLNFGAMKSPKSPPPSMPINIWKATSPVDFFVADEGPENKARAFAAVVKMPTLTAYASAVSMILPEFKDDLKELLRDTGKEGVDVSLPSQALIYSIEMPTAVDEAPFSWPKMLIIFGAGVLFIFKDVNAHSFEEIMEARFNALKVTMAPSAAEEIVENPFTLKQAKTVHRCFGVSTQLKRKMLETFIRCSEKGGVFGGCCLYLMRELAWCDMHSFKYIYDTFFATCSPILDDPMLASEVMSVRGAASMVMSFPRPAYFMLLAFQGDQYALEMSRFPIMMSLAALIGQESGGGSVPRIVPRIDGSNLLIRRLMAMHRIAMNKKNVCVTKFLG